MSGGNRGYIATAIFGLVVTTSGLTLWLATPAAKSYQKCQHSQSSDGRSSESRAYPINERPIVSGVPGFVQRLTGNNDPCHGEDNEKRDLAAQEAAAAWSFWMVGLTALQLLIGGIGVFLVVQSLRQGTKASSDTLASERPYLFIWRTKKHTETGKCEGVWFKNFGRTPAFVERLKIETVVDKDPPVPDRLATGGRVFHRHAIAVHAEEWPGAGAYPVTVPERFVGKYKVCGKRVFAVGSIIYRDPFDQRHSHWFCYEYDGRNFTPGRLHNEELNGYSTLEEAEKWTKARKN